MLKITNLNYLHIINDISFSVKDSEFVSLLGKNGSGKTSILKCICGIYKDFTGEISIKNVLTSSIKQKVLAEYVSYVPQIIGTYIPFTVKDFLKMSMFSKKDKLLSNKEKKIEEILNFLSLKEFENRIVSTLSGGEMQKILLAAALTQDTPFLLLDEPTSHLDPSASFQMMKSLKLVKNQYKKGIIMVSHKIDEVLELSDRVIALTNGSITLDLQSEKVDKNFLNKAVYNLSKKEIENE